MTCIDERVVLISVVERVLLLADDGSTWLFVYRETPK